METPGTLFLIPVLMGDTMITDVIPEKTLIITRTLKFFIAENAKSARQFLKLVPGISAMSEIDVKEMDKHSKSIDFDFYFDSLRKGNDTGLMSEAGLPGVADPGSAFVLRAHQEGIRVVPLTGPSSILLALIASGLNGQSFAFNGYLPIEKDQRILKIQNLEKLAERFQQTQIFIETPYRNQSLFSELINTCQPSRKLCLATDITLPTESIQTRTVSEWRKQKVDLNKRPTVFLFL